MSEKRGTPVSLRELSPRFEAKHHQVYVDALADAVTRNGTGAPRNIALTGPYGSGKSSVIDGLSQRLRQDQKDKRWFRRANPRVVTLSLSSLGISTDSDDDDTVSNRIQKEIVKQLLYREPASRMPSSRYQRIQPFRWRTAISGSVFIAALFVAVVELIGKPNRLAANGRLLLGAAAVLALVLVVAQWRLAGRVWLEKITAGPATLALSKPSNSYFDDYLDEIVYFFMTSGCRIVVFEDLDRFNNARIFETLRGLNTILNGAQQLNPDDNPIRFVYAVRDSIFDLLDDDAGTDPAAAAETIPRRANRQPIEPPSTSRTKFFDLVVPLVPFITAQTSRDILAEVMKESRDCPSGEVIKIVAGHITDMRLINNIHNEYQIFKTQILPEYGGLPGLTANGLFAMVAYKNHHLSDFEKIKSGTSNLDQVYAAYRRLVNEQTSTRQQEVLDLRLRIEQNVLTPERCAELGEELLRFFRAAELALSQSLPDPSRDRIRLASAKVYDLKATTTQEFWHEALANTGSAEIILGGNWRGIQRADLFYAAGVESPDDLHSDAQTEWSARIGEAQAAIDAMRWASLTRVFEAADLTLTTANQPVSLREFAIETLASPLAIELIAAGYIDENFALYVAQYYETHVSAAAKNFILQVADRGEQDTEYRFRSDDDVRGLIDELGIGFLRTRSAHNIAIFDFVLSKAPHLAQPVVEGLVQGSEDEIPFLAVYLTRGAHPALLISKLSPAWDHIFTFLASSGTSGATDLLSAALDHAAPDRPYATDARVRDQIAQSASQLPVLNGRLTGSPPSIATVLGRLGVQIIDVNTLDPKLQREVIRNNAYRVTRPNLVRALIKPTTSLSLDTLLPRDRQVYDHVIRNLPDYLKILEDDSAQFSVDDPTRFAAVLQTLADATLTSVVAILRRFEPGCLVEDLTAIPDRLWRVTVGAERCIATVTNILAYLDKYEEFDDTLGDLLDAAGTISGVAGTSESERQGLAIQIINAESIPPDRIQPLLESLRLEAPVPSESVTREIGPLVPNLVAGGLLTDDRHTYDLVARQPRDIKDEFVRASRSFVEYCRQLPVTGTDLVHLIVTDRIPMHIRATVLNHYEDGLASLTAEQATRIARSAATADPNISFSSLAALSRAGAEPAAILPLLPPMIDQLTPADLTNLLSSLSKPYDALANSTAADPALVPNTCRDVFDKLKATGHIHNYEKVRNKPQLRVARSA